MYLSLSSLCSVWFCAALPTNLALSAWHHTFSLLLVMTQLSWLFISSSLYTLLIDIDVDQYAPSNLTISNRMYSSCADTSPCPVKRLSQIFCIHRSRFPHIFSDDNLFEFLSFYIFSVMAICLFLSSHNVAEKKWLLLMFVMSYLCVLASFRTLNFGTHFSCWRHFQQSPVKAHLWGQEIFVCLLVDQVSQSYIMIGAK